MLDAMRSRGLEPTDAEIEKLVACDSDFSKPSIGLSEADLDDLLGSLTHVIHSAWAVNFNIGLRSFEEQHVKGVQNLINLCLRVRHSEPARFFFCSSVSSAGNTPKPARISESTVQNLDHAQNFGYGQSKLVGEHITRNAMQQTAIHSKVLRIGQLSADRRTARWNMTESVALMIRSALTTGSLPTIDEVRLW